MFHVSRSVALVLAGVALSACSTDRPTAAVEPTAPSARLTLPSGTAAELRDQERLERSRVERARAASAPAFRLLREGWKAGGERLKAGSPVLVCAPQPYDAEVRVVGPEGGVLRAGQHMLSIPRGALAEPTVITMEAPVSLAAAVRFSPHGLQFQAPATLTVGYAQCILPAGVPKGVAYVDDGMDLLEWIRADDAAQGAVVADVWHFSRYALAKRSNYAVAW